MPIATVADLSPEDDSIGERGPDGEQQSSYGPGGIYHEKQVGALCAVHCLNNLMQERMFDEVILAEVAQALDREEQRLLGGGAVSGGGNVREDGFFNVQVIRAALQRAGFQMETLSGPEARSVAAEPAKQRGFICNRKEHWFALRRIGQEWFDVNSCLKTPRHFTDAELIAHVNEALGEGYTLFVIRGEYPRSSLETDNKKLLEAVQGCGHMQQTHCLFTGQGHTLGGTAQSAPSSAAATVDPELLAMAEHDPELAAAIAASLETSQPPAPASPPAAESADEMRRKRLARFG